MPWALIENLSLPVLLNCLFSVAEIKLVSNSATNDSKNSRFISCKLLMIKV